MQDTRARILREALKLFAEQGAGAASMRQLAARAKVNVATAYHHFGSKRGLILAIFREYGFLDATEQPVEQAAAHLKGSPRRIIERILFDTWSVMAVGAEFIRFLMLEALTGDTEAVAIANEFRDRGQRNLEAVLIYTEIARGSNAVALATTLRELIWAVFYEGLLNDTLTEEWYRDRAASAGVVLAPRAFR